MNYIRIISYPNERRSNFPRLNYTLLIQVLFLWEVTISPFRPRFIGLSRAPVAEKSVTSHGLIIFNTNLSRAPVAEKSVTSHGLIIFNTKYLTAPKVWCKTKRGVPPLLQWIFSDIFKKDVACSCVPFSFIKDKMLRIYPWWMKKLFVFSIFIPVFVFTFGRKRKCYIEHGISKIGIFL